MLNVWKTRIEMRILCDIAGLSVNPLAWGSGSGMTIVIERCSTDTGLQTLDKMILLNTAMFNQAA